MKKTLSIFLAITIFQLGYAQDYNTAIEKARFLILAHQAQTKTPGIQVALMAGDSLVWSESFGYSDLERHIPVKQFTKFRIASVSKSVTSVALGKMMEQKEIDIDQDIRYYLPEFPEKKHVITPRQLASSTSGIRHYTDKDPKYNAVNYDDVLSSLKIFQQGKLLFEPGTDFHYSSYGWVLLSAVMEKASGTSFFQIMEETWAKLKMHNTTFDYPNRQGEHVSRFYIYDKKRGRVIAPEDNRSYMYAGGGYLSTAEDLARMGNMLLEHKYVNENTVNELFRSQKLEDETETHYGLGWETGVSRIGSPVVYHSGSMSSARSHLILYPKEKIVFVYLANTGDQIFFNEREAQNIAEIFVHAHKGEKNTKNEAEPLGRWEISTNSLRNKKTKGTLELNKENGIIIGEMEYKRSREKKKFPIILTEHNNSIAHLVAVSPMFIDLYITISDDSFKGEWLHDFNVKGVQEADEYWNPREIIGERTIPKDK